MLSTFKLVGLGENFYGNEFLETLRYKIILALFPSILLICEFNIYFLLSSYKQKLCVLQLDNTIDNFFQKITLQKLHHSNSKPFFFSYILTFQSYSIQRYSFYIVNHSI